MSDNSEVIYPPRGYWIGLLSGSPVDGMIGPFDTEAGARQGMSDLRIVVTGQRAPWDKPLKTTYTVEATATVDCTVLGHHVTAGDSVRSGPCDTKQEAAGIVFDLATHPHLDMITIRTNDGTN
jgi:hypothetical protein